MRARHGVLCLACWAWPKKLLGALRCERCETLAAAGQKHCKTRRKKRWKANALARQHANKERYYRIRFRLSPTAALK
jgi:hypothetical protein